MEILQDQADGGVCVSLPTHFVADNYHAGSKQYRHHPQGSRFSIQRLDTADISGTMPRRRASVNHGQSSGSHSAPQPSSCVTMSEVDLTYSSHPAIASAARDARPSGSVRDHSNG